MNEETPNSLAAYFTQGVRLWPVVPNGRLMRSVWMVRMRLWIAKRYWATRKPEVYLLCLCSALATRLMDEGIVMPHSEQVQAPDDCLTLTSDFRQAVHQELKSLYMQRFLNRINKTMTVYQWSGGREVVHLLEGHVSFIWAAVSAVQDRDLQVTSVTEENLQELRSCIPTWLQYLESISRLLLR